MMVLRPLLPGNSAAHDLPLVPPSPGATAAVLRDVQTKESDATGFCRDTGRPLPNIRPALVSTKGDMAA